MADFSSSDFECHHNYNNKLYIPLLFIMRLMKQILLLVNDSTWFLYIKIIKKVPYVKTTFSGFISLSKN